VVADTADVLTTAASHDSIAIGFCTLITLFAVLFGTSKEKNREQHDGLVMAIAFESLVKLLAFLIIGGFSVYGGFGGFESMVGWVESQSLSTYRELNEFKPVSNINCGFLCRLCNHAPHVLYHFHRKQ
jgi:Na+/proline symporter